MSGVSTNKSTVQPGLLSHFSFDWIFHNGNTDYLNMKPTTSWILVIVTIAAVLLSSFHRANAQRQQQPAGQRKNPAAFWANRGGGKGKNQPTAPLVVPDATVAAKNNNHLKSLAIAGKLAGFFGTLKKARLQPILKGLHVAFEATDILWLGAIGWLTEPIAKLCFHWFGETEDDYKHSITAKIANMVSEIAKVSVVVYFLDMISVVAHKIGFHIPSGLNDQLAKLCYTLWGFRRIRQIKNWWINHVVFRRHTTDEEVENNVKAQVTNRLLDGVMAVFLAFFIQDIFQVTMGKGLQSIFAVGGLSTVILSLASKDVAQMIVSGLVINSGDKFIVGENIELGDGTSGTVQKLGIFELQLRGGDGVVIRIPNGQVVNQRVKNLSRTAESMVKQTLWFKYDDIEKLPATLESIKAEIVSSCPELITDGSRPFRAHWVAFEDDHLEAVVQAHFKIKPNTDRYHEARQQLLQAVARAVHGAGLEFALPTSAVKDLNPKQQC
jgi:small-conductance mechanosensitive channel